MAGGMTRVMVKTEAVCKSFGSLSVLRGIDLELERGQVMCLLGPSGSGKSTLLRCINHLETVDSGRIFVGGQLMGYRQEGTVLRQLRDREVNRQRARIGMVFQRFNLFPHLTALGNVIEAPRIVRGVERKVAVQDAEILLERVGLADKRSAYPAQLSGGQQQRVAIARALAMRPELMLFDEPTSALDPELVNEVLEAIQNLAAAGMTMIVVTHELGFARNVSDRAVFIDDGMVVESGTPSDVLVSPRQERTRGFLSKAY